MCRRYRSPPKSVSGTTETTAIAVGAHQAHLVASPVWHHKVECADCHVVDQELVIRVVL
jgi:hypothetical protein